MRAGGAARAGVRARVGVMALGRARSSAPAQGQRRACGSSAALVVVASSSFSCGVWWPSVRQQAASHGQRGFAAHPAVAPEKEQRRERERRKKGKGGWSTEFDSN